ncbi:MAG: hypothetical protein ACT4PE_01125 [Candidatus Eiseniibacteriota bacterium]
MIRRGLASASLALVALSGCLGEPPIEETWTRLEILDASPTDAAAFAVGSATTAVTMRARVTYREILTGFLVAELRAGSGITTAETALDADDPLAVAREVDQILGSSTAIGTEAIPVTGWDSLVQELTITFDAGTPTPTAMDSSVAGAGSNPVTSTGLFLLLYFSDDVQEVELQSGEEIEIVTPVLSDQRDILSTGIEIVPAS